MCKINLHSIINSGLIPGSQHLNNRLTVFFLVIDLRDIDHKDPEKIDLNEPRHAQYMHDAWKRHQKASSVLDRHQSWKAIIHHETLPAYCIPKIVRMENGEVLYEKVCMSPRLPPKISLKHDWKRELGSEHAQRPEGQVVQQSTSFQSNQPIFKPKSRQIGATRCRTKHRKLCQMVAKHVLVMKAWDSMMKTKDFVRDRGNDLSTMTIQVMSSQCWTRWTWTSEFQGYHILLWSMRRVQAPENWFRKLRATQADMLFNKIYGRWRPHLS